MKADLNKVQLQAVQKDFKNYIKSFSDMGISDYEYSDGNIRVFVDFGFCLRDLEIKGIEILNDDYEALQFENAVHLKEYIKDLITEYNEQTELKLLEELSDQDSYNIAEELAKERYYHNKYAI